MKNIIPALAVMLLCSTTMQSCYGPFQLTNKVYNWNGEFKGFEKHLIFWALLIIPVYEVAAILDALILNTIQFWTGNNPLSMKEGEMDTQLVQSNGKLYEITATKNKFLINEVTDGASSNEVSLIYKPSEKSWNLRENGKTVKLAEQLDESTVGLYAPHGRSFVRL
ncbi:MAG: DUF3332 domain-containing protein [Flavobacteriales bacterium]|nr:DUF3332 domain-containing protein [Flavobacteriales bacterium]